MFDCRKYTMKFKKNYMDAALYGFDEVPDSYLTSALLELQEKYDFEIVSMKFNNCFNFSCIKIKCHKKDKQKIFMEYCMSLKDLICNVSI